MLFNSYNCLPGWSPIAPLRELLSICYKHKVSGGKNSDEQINSALKLFDLLRGRGGTLSKCKAGLRDECLSD